MISFSEYMQSPPKVFFSVGKNILTESISIDSTFFLGKKEHAPTQQPIMRGVYHDPNSDGFLHYKNDGSTVRLKSLESAELFVDSLRRSHDKQVHKVNKDLENHYHEASTHPVYSKHVDRYTSEGDINSKLLNDEELDESDKHHVKTLDEALTHTKTPDDIVLYSGTNAPHAKELQRKDVVHHPSYISTSLTINKAVDFASSKNGDLVEIHVPKDHDGMYIDHMSDFSEREFLLPRGMNLRIHKDKQKVLVTPSKTFTVHYATIEK